MTVTQATGTVRVSTGTVPLGLVPQLPFVQPARRTLAATGRDVLAYYHTFPLYWQVGSTLYADNIRPTGNSSANIASGGKWRQRPYPFVDNSTLTDAIRQQWMTVDIQNAWNIGIDGFRQEIITETAITQNYRWTEHVSQLYAAAETFNATHTPGFRVCPDMDGGSISTNSGNPTAWADFIAPLLKSSAAYTWQGTGRPVVFCFNFSAMTTTWWDSFIAELKTQGIPNPAIIPAYTAGTTGTLDSWLSYFTTGTPSPPFVALHNWTTVNYTTTPSTIQSAVRGWCATNGVPFVGTAGPAWENDRPANSPQPKESEGYGLTTLMNEWQACILNADPLASIISWGDHEESHNIRPSTGYQWAPYDVCAYYLAQYKTGVAPTITRDAVYYAHRMHKGTTAYSTTQQTAGAFTVAFGPTVDLVVAHTFLKAPADVTITTGGTAHTTTSVPAGVSTVTAPLVEGDTPSFKVTRAGVDVVPTFSSAFPTRSSITWQDLCYRMGSSTRPPIAGVQSDLPQDR